MAATRDAWNSWEDAKGIVDAWRTKWEPMDGQSSDGFATRGAFSDALLLLVPIRRHPGDWRVEIRLHSSVMLA